MRHAAQALAAGAALLCLIAAPGAAQQATGSVFKATAEALTAGKTGRFDKAQALHNFTRDEIRQVATRYS
ncbi:MAG: hypothetical protein FJ225_10245 [Lentisphaerae bacterium]|nr:hypothetical protein [Lentisphaerota bacterium]